MDTYLQIECTILVTRYFSDIKKDEVTSTGMGGDLITTHNCIIKLITIIIIDE